MVLLTCGTVSAGGTNISHAARECLGIPRDWPIPQKPELARFAADYCLAAGAQLCPVEWAYRVRLQNVSYHALMCRPVCGR